MDSLNDQTVADMWAFEPIKPVRATYLATYAESK